MGNFDRYSGQKAARNYNQISDGMKSMANAAKRKFAKDYPEVKVKIDGRQGWIIVNGVKAVNVSSASSRPMSIEDMVDQMKQAYLGHPMAEAKLKSSIRRIINERGTGNPAIQAEERALMNAVVEFSDAYMMTMGMNPGDSADAKRVRNTINDIINSVMGVL
tara:strand:+ start:279 stop:764 length:486 start_codon:yes stop_codon:yes gene_type:complete